MSGTAPGAFPWDPGDGIAAGELQWDPGLHGSPKPPGTQGGGTAAVPGVGGCARAPLCSLPDEPELYVLIRWENIKL